MPAASADSGVSPPSAERRELPCQELVVAERVVDHRLDRVVEVVAHLRVGCGVLAAVTGDWVVQDDPLGVEVAEAILVRQLVVEGAHEDRTPRRAQAGALAVVGEHRELGVRGDAGPEGVGGLDHHGIVHLREHALERLVEVDAVLVGVEARVLVRGVERRPRLALDVAGHERRVVELRVGRVVVDHRRRRNAAARADHGRIDAPCPRE